jgi:hypothetical protein
LFSGVLLYTYMKMSQQNPLHNYYILIKNLKKGNQLVQSHSNDNSIVTVQKQT